MVGGRWGIDGAINLHSSHCLASSIAHMTCRPEHTRPVCSVLLALIPSFNHFTPRAQAPLTSSEPQSPFDPKPEPQSHRSQHSHRPQPSPPQPSLTHHDLSLGSLALGAISVHQQAVGSIAVHQRALGPISVHRSRPQSTDTKGDVRCEFFVWTDILHLLENNFRIRENKALKTWDDVLQHKYDVRKREDKLREMTKNLKKEKQKLLCLY